MRLSIFVFFTCCITLLHALPLSGQKISFHITILKSTGEPQPGIILKIKNSNLEYIGNEQGIITFDYEVKSSYSHTAELYLPSDKAMVQSAFPLDQAVADTTIYIDSPEDIAALKQAGTTFPIEGFVRTRNGEPITEATISIQGTGRMVQSDEIGLFHIEADYNHPIVIRARGMETLSLDITRFLQYGYEPLPIIMNPKSSSRIYRSVEQMPRFPGGMKAMGEYIKRHLKYPEQAKKAGIEGVVGIQFIVETNGEISSPYVVRHLGEELDAAALQVIQAMPRWIAGKDHGIPVRCKLSIPILFKLPKEETSSSTSSLPHRPDTPVHPKKEILPAALSKPLPINLLPLQDTIVWQEYFRPQKLELSWPHALHNKKSKRPH